MKKGEKYLQTHSIKHKFQVVRKCSLIKKNEKSIE